jgi:hypothetical protein
MIQRIKSELFFVRRLWFNPSRMFEHPTKVATRQAMASRYTGAAGPRRGRGYATSGVFRGRATGRAVAYPRRSHAFGMLA